jgi:thymidylate synthase (FAD)
VSRIQRFSRTFGSDSGIIRKVRETSPSVFIIARPQIDRSSIESYLHSVDGLSWLELRDGDAEATDAELLVEFGGRLCYRSWKAGLNPNVKRIRTERGEYFDNLLSSGHGSVLEHANFSFAFHQVSRVFTHELVRHRAGCAYSQESLRYVRLVDIGFRVAPALDPVREEVISIVERLEEFQRTASDALLDEDMPFAEKKEVTSALRRLAPIGLSTDILWTANVRTLRHVIAQRTLPTAEEEMRSVFSAVAELAIREAPMLFQDFSQKTDGSWAPAHPKV